MASTLLCVLVQVFPVAEIPAGFEAGTYDLCYCDALSDETLDTTAGGSTYTVEGDKVCGGTTTTGAELHSNVLKVSQLNSAAKEELCMVKCSRGCVGKACYCDSYDPSTMFFAEDIASLNADEGYPLCTDAAGCRDACNAITDCGASAALCFAVVPSHGLSICHMCIFKRWTAF